MSTTTGTARLERLGARARTAAEELRAAIHEEITAGRVSENAAAKAAGMDRMAVRRIMGKTR